MKAVTLLIYRPDVDFTVPPGVERIPICLPVEPSSEWLDNHDALLTDDPEKADWIIFPLEFCHFIAHFGYARLRDFLNKLQHFQSYEGKHVFYESGDLDNPLGIESVVFKTSLSCSRRDPNAQAFPYPAHDFVRETAPGLDFSKIRHEVSFTGSIQHQVRIPLMRSLVSEPGLDAFVETPRESDVTKSSWYYLPEGESKRSMEARYVQSLVRSLAVMSPRGIGHVCFRFYEAMCMGRIPVLVDDDGCLPFEDEINYESFSLRIPESRAHKAGSIIKKWLQSKTPEQLKLMCLLAREIWERHFDNDRLAERMLRSLRKMPERREGVWLSRPHEIRSQAEPKRVRRQEALAPLVLDPEGVGRYGQYWVNRGIQALKDPVRPGWITANDIQGLLRFQDIETIYEAGSALPSDGVAVVLGPQGELSSALIASGMIGSLRLDAMAYVLGGACDESILATAGIEHMVRVLPEAPHEGATLFRDRSVDLLFMEATGDSGPNEALVEVWARTLKPNAQVLVNTPAGLSQCPVRPSGSRA